MSHIHDLIRERLLARAGIHPGATAQVRLEVLERSEWSPRFERLMRNRLIMGALRYGRLGVPGKPQFDRITSAIRRLEKYQASGNQELLVDAANLALVEFVEGTHRNKHFAAEDDGEHAARI